MGNINKYNYGLGSKRELYIPENKQENLHEYVNQNLAKTNIMFKYDGLPETIPAEILESILQTSGFCAIAKHNGNLYAFNGGLAGVEDSPYHLPTKIIVTNPALKLSKTFIFDKDCILFKSDPFAIGLIPIITRYCTSLVENDLTIHLASVNARIQTYLSAGDEPTRQSAVQFLKDIANGKQGVIAESKLFDSLKFNQNSQQQGIFKDLIELQQYQKASLYNEMGLSANFNMKRERLSSAEVNGNTDNLYPFIDSMLEERKKAVLKINEMFDLEISVTFGSTWERRATDTAEPADTAELSDTAEPAETADTAENDAPEDANETPPENTENKEV